MTGKQKTIQHAPPEAGSNRSGNRAFASVLEAHLTRRDILRGAGWLGLAAVASTALRPLRALAQAVVASSPTFAEVKKGLFPTHQLPPGYRAQLVLRWGDRLFPDAPPFDWQQQSAQAQSRQFGFNNDYIAYLPFLPGQPDSAHGLLAVNHEYTSQELMFPPLPADADKVAEEGRRAGIEQAAHGMSIMEIRKNPGGWELILGSEKSRRITAYTPMTISGPAAGNARMKTKADPAGRTVLGTIANCGGGITPWGTILTCEENFNDYFQAPESPSEPLRRYGVGPARYYRWHAYDTRFDTGVEPNEPNRFGWVVEINPYDLASTPKKRTALGRFKHETATITLAPDNRVVAYSGDDEINEYLYRFVSSKPYNPSNPAANADLLDDGALYVAKFSEDGQLLWLPLIHGQGPLTTKNGFANQGDVVIETRRAADLMGATPMDRPEGIAVHPQSGEIFLSLTRNDKREESNTDSANPRPANRYGHILRLIPPSKTDKADHAADRFTWEPYLMAGNPAQADHLAKYPGQVSENGWLANPDNLAFDPQGRLWIATDGQPKSVNLCDGLYAADAAGAVRQFFTAPLGAEVTGPCFTPDGTTLFLSIQHPAEGSDLAAPSTRWPDFNAALPPRSSVLAITRDDSGPIGG